jgi:spermidine synthase
MIPWERIARARAPGGGELVLSRRGAEYVIRCDGHELMSSRLHGSEEALARLACAPLAGRPAPRVLIGGLGLGYTLRAALGALPAAARVRVVEVVPEVVDWCRGPLADLHGHALEDARVEVEVGDVGVTVRAGQRWDAILLDVDNGPQAMTRKANQILYADIGVTTARRALRPGGVLAYWSAAADPAFERRLRRLGLEVAAHRVPGHDGGGGPTHHIFIATVGPR